LLSDRETETIVRWVENGALAGDPKDAPPPLYEDLGMLSPRFTHGGTD
jgi:hypothetical protein